MKTKKIFIAIALVTITFFNAAAQQTETSERKTRFSLEIDPATFVFGGYSAHIRIQPANCDHLLFGLGAYAMDMPSLLVDLNSNNKNEGWDVRINQGYGLFVEHHFSEVNKKWFVGAQASFQEYKIEKDGIQGSEKFSNILAMGYAGYTFKPFDFNFYIKPWAGIGYTSKISGENTLAGNEYDISPITMFVTVHLGYTF